MITVTAVEGVVVPAMAFGTEDDEDWWPGVGEATEWEFPVARVQGTSAYLVVHNPGLGAVEVAVDLFTAEGPILEAFTATVGARVAGSLRPVAVPRRSSGGAGGGHRAGGGRGGGSWGRGRWP